MRAPACRTGLTCAPRAAGGHGRPGCARGAPTWQNRAERTAPAEETAAGGQRLANPTATFFLCSLRSAPEDAARGSWQAPARRAQAEPPALRGEVGGAGPSKPRPATWHSTGTIQPGLSAAGRPGRGGGCGRSERAAGAGAELPALLPRG